MTRRLFPLAFIFVCTTVAWIILGATTELRTNTQDENLRGRVGRLWGTEQRQSPPIITDGVNALGLDSSVITVDLKADHRKKGLLWYSTYRVLFDAKYRVTAPADTARTYAFRYRFPAQEGIYDNFRVLMNGTEVTNVEQTGEIAQVNFNPAPGTTTEFEVAYGSQGLNKWWYEFGNGVTQIRNFHLAMTTDFDDINFPDNSIAATGETKTASGWKLNWDYKSLVSGIQIGMEIPQRLNPGPFVSRVSYFAPVSLFFFLFLMFIITTIRRINIHPMNYFFLAAAFSSFHLLLSYLADHVSLAIAFALASIVSIGLVTSYMRMVVGLKFALFEVGLAQFVYLVLFSLAFFLEGYTGLAVTVCAILTLFAVMQLTGKVDWSEQFREISDPAPFPPIS